MQNYDKSTFQSCIIHLQIKKKKKIIKRIGNDLVIKLTFVIKKIIN